MQHPFSLAELSATTCWMPSDDVRQDREDVASADIVLKATFDIPGAAGCSSPASARARFSPMYSTSFSSTRTILVPRCPHVGGVGVEQVQVSLTGCRLELHGDTRRNSTAFVPTPEPKII